MADERIGCGRVPLPMAALMEGAAGAGQAADRWTRRASLLGSSPSHSLHLSLSPPRAARCASLLPACFSSPSPNLHESRAVGAPPLLPRSAVDLVLLELLLSLPWLPWI